MRRAFLSFVLALGAVATGCSPEIGDECDTSVDCSVNGDRICDTAQRGGYCTVRNCELGTCPEESLCVEWRGQPVRTADRWCMKSCEDDGDCRDDEGYRCVRADDPRLATNGASVARVIERSGEGARFCAAVGP